MRAASLSRLLVALKVVVIVGFMAPFWHWVYLISHRPTSPDVASGYVEAVNQKGTPYFITRGEKLAQNVMWGILLSLWAVTLVVMLVDWYRRTRET